MKIQLKTLVASAIWVTLSACASPNSSDVNDTKVIKQSGETLIVNNSYVIRLNSTPTAGYQWTATTTDQASVRVRRLGSIKNTDPKTVGGSDVESWEITPLRTGNLSVTFKYGRSWEPTVSDQKVYSFRSVAQ
jgi:predicted secreted protein